MANGDLKRLQMIGEAILSASVRIDLSLPEGVVGIKPELLRASPWEMLDRQGDG